MAGGIARDSKGTDIPVAGNAYLFDIGHCYPRQLATTPRQQQLPRSDGSRVNPLKA